jgi:hypothetical protein
MKVMTTKGLIEAADLDPQDFITWSDNARVIATEWRLQGELVRRDVWVSALRPIEGEAKIHAS